MTFEEYMVGAGLAPSTRKLYMAHAARIGDDDPVAWFRAEVARNQPTSTLLPLRATAKHMMIWRGAHPDDADRALPKAKGRTAARREGLTKAQLNVFLDAVQTCPDPARSVLLILPFTGLRIAEAANVRWADLKRQGNRLTLHVSAGKGRKARMVPLNKTATRILAMRKQARAPGCLWVFAGVRGTPVTPDYIRKALKKALSGRSGMDHVTPHTLRHTFASNLAAQDVGLRRIQALLGHASIASTERYVHPTTAQLQEDVNRLDRADQSQPAPSGRAGKTT